MKRFLLASALAAGLLALSGCQPVYWVGMRLLYDEAELPDEQIRRDVAYRSGSDAQKHRLDLFLPDSATTASGWPTVVFVHGGGWTEGDKDLRVGYEDVYGNIGRFFASRGIGAAVINYRLLDLQDESADAVQWPDQVADVAAAVAFVHRRIGRYGGDPDALFLMGHSAGAQLAARVALDPQPLARHGLAPQEILAGVISVSGAGLDLTDERTYELSDDPAYYARRFARRGVPRPDWQTAVSPASYIDAGDPPFLVLFAGDESDALKRQSRIFDAALQQAGVASRLVTVPGQSHERIVLTLSRDDRTAGPAMLDFIRERTGTRERP